mmetsp:Transcript_34585/g.87477  ORF Transcript_34585/g.87477 Transcript_34585/m.87477 type:complete len:141 (+) Transcript_34585:258-680(+)
MHTTASSKSRHMHACIYIKPARHTSSPPPQFTMQRKVHDRSCTAGDLAPMQQCTTTDTAAKQSSSECPGCTPHRHMQAWGDATYPADPDTQSCVHPPPTLHMPAPAAEQMRQLDSYMIAMHADTDPLHEPSSGERLAHVC